MKNELRVWLSILLMISALLVLTTMMDGDIFRSIGYFFLALCVGTPFSFPLLFCSLTAVDLLLHPVLVRHTPKQACETPQTNQTGDESQNPTKVLLEAASVACAFLWMLCVLLLRDKLFNFLYFSIVPIILSATLWCICALSPRYNNGEMRSFAALATVASAAIAVFLICTIFGFTVNSWG